ncbi:MAG: hypothetical protein MI921_09725 [Cytophagales bacterium]|nr:hypothetical protein [Cytophagales bacterium]
MELMLNELSISPPSSDKYQANDKMIQFAQTVNQARQKGFKNIRSHHHTSDIVLTDGYSLYNWLNNKEVPEDYRNFLYGTIVLPFIKDEDEEIADQYIEANFSFEDITHGYPKTECLGLAAAHLYETLSISFASAPVWCRIQLPLIIEKDQVLNTEQVFNLFSIQSFKDAGLAAFVENLGNIELQETTIKPEDKKITLFGDHHGKKELQALCDKLKNDPFVKEMRSTGFGGTQFIRKIYSNGAIEIALTKTDSRYALWVQTTGRNYRETAAIAERLKERYS